ncbi:MAG: RdgB/HAM1 family non-canonical purine NTP pyrophosphatase [Acidimicrobiia bacterium]|nr:RdgB/HAM1 family non-canonical purine NTP pyrophosphatase [Actinomycetota bacterium]MBL6925578.1 RdgB/HAM1 family non-canonical purine NTP pyrophosphatase [Acidimicrobiia bacterium]MBL6927461.1 RdgB/HAM1 family non-canonical purine NTP pyrophosphatase [Acidimicrobiia bacterium]
MPAQRLVLASANPDKVAELRLLLNGVVEVMPRPTDLAEVVENEETLEGNARLKAAAVCRATDCAAIADDTGLFVDALGGRPGVRSARFAGDDATYADNLAKLLEELASTPPERRSARFQTVVMVKYPDGRELTATGTVEGHIAESPTGGGGFGYDPVFVPVEGDGRSFAEMGDDKHRFSHRGRALRAIVPMLDITPAESAG